MRRRRVGHAGGRGSSLSLCVVIVSGVLVYLLRNPDAGSPAPVATSASDHGSDVRVTGPRCICLRPDCPLCQKLQVATVETTQITAPVLMVTGWWPPAFDRATARGTITGNSIPPSY